MGRVCPWWMGYCLGSWLRGMMQRPELILGPYVHAGQAVADIGCGPGLFAVAMAKMVGPAGRVIAIDLQPQMLAMVRRRAEREGVAERIVLRQCQQHTLGPLEKLDFALAMAMVHEVPDRDRLLREVAAALMPGGLLLVCEPKMHVWQANFDKTVRLALCAGLEPSDGPPVHMSRSVIFRKSAEREAGARPSPHDVLRHAQR